jgi:hypothetical protein
MGRSQDLGRTGRVGTTKGCQGSRVKNIAVKRRESGYDCSVNFLVVEMSLSSKVTRREQVEHIHSTLFF